MLHLKLKAAIIQSIYTHQSATSLLPLPTQCTLILCPNMLKETVTRMGVPHHTLPPRSKLRGKLMYYSSCMWITYMPNYVQVAF